jgi:DNA repair protein RadC
VLASLRSVKTHLAVFDTAVVDLTEKLADPVDVLFGTQLGGGTDIHGAVTYCQSLVREPRNTVLVLISDGQPTDNFDVGLKALMESPWGRTAVRIAIAIGEDADHDILQRFTSLADLASRDVVELMSIHGMGSAKATTLCAAFELARRIQAEPFTERITVSTPAVLAHTMIPRMRHLRTESFRVVLLNSANQVIREVCVSDGSLNAVLIHPREVFRLAIAESAAAIIVAHNHPSGNTEPSGEDIAITKQLIEAGRIVDIKVLDHLIIAGNTYTSFVERGLM